MVKKLMILFFIMIICFVFLFGRIFYIKFINGDLFARRVLEQQTSYNKVLTEKRGDIYDRNGKVLATSVKAYDLILDPLLLSKSVEEKQNEALDALVEVYDLDRDEIKSYIDDPQERQYVPLIKELSYEDKTRFEEYKEEKEVIISGVWFDENYVRKYPYDFLASHVLGFTTNDNRGNWGIEQYYNDYLTGSQGREFGVIVDGMYMKTEYREPTNGYNVVSTIDLTIQYYTEKALENFFENYTALGATAIVMNPNTGEILALANYPNFDLNNPTDLSHLYSDSYVSGLSEEEKLNLLNSLWRNGAVSNTYEPGSTFKPITVAAALEEGIYTGDELFYCSGHKTFENVSVPVRCWEREGHGYQTLGEAIANSCNVVMMDIAEEMGREVFSNYQREFGFGSKTNVDILGEESAESLLYDVNDMKPIDLATNSFGQNFNVTPIQLITAFSGVVNGGDLIKPHIVKKIVNEQGDIIESFESEIVKKLISKDTSDKLKSYLHYTVEEGTGSNVYIDGYTIGGKTGTAEKLPRGSGKYIVSFIGFAPVEDPQVVALVAIDEPNINDANSLVAMEVFREIMSNILPYIDIYPSIIVDEDEEVEDAENGEESNSIEDRVDDVQDEGSLDNDEESSEDDIINLEE